MPQLRSLLLALPDALLREVTSWCPDGATASALLCACRTTRHLRRDPATAALLLLRCRCRYYLPALASCSATCQGGTPAVTQQVLQLLSVLLCAAATAGDTAAVCALLALPHPPGVDDVAPADAWSIASPSALSCACDGPHLPIMQALLDRGADACADKLSLFCWTALAPARLPALRLLLQHCPTAATRAAATDTALATAVIHHCVPAVQHLLPLVTTASLDFESLASHAALGGEPAVLRLLLKHHPLAAPRLHSILDATAGRGHTSCVAVLMDCGAAPKEATLLGAVRHHPARVLNREEACPDSVGFVPARLRLAGPASPYVRFPGVFQEDRRRTVALLLGRGGVAVTPAVRRAVTLAGFTYLLPLLLEAEAGGGGNGGVTLEDLGRGTGSSKKASCANPRSRTAVCTGAKGTPL